MPREEDRFRRTPSTIGPYDALKGPNGRCLCRQCGVEVKPPRRTFCSKTCVDLWLVEHHPPRARDAVLKRDHGICAGCGLDCVELEKELERLGSDVWSRGWDAVLIRSADLKAFGQLIDKHQLPRHLAGITGSRGWFRTLWEADHIVPVVEGGGCCGLENYRTLCWKCHKQETAKLASRRAAKRRAVKRGA